MDLSGLRNSKDQTREVSETKDVEFLCFGKSVDLIKRYNEMRLEIGEQIAFISERSYERDDLRLKGPTIFRASSSEESCTGKDDRKKSIFFKDQKFRSFEGRSKNAVLKNGEEFFTPDGLKHLESKFNGKFLSEVELEKFNEQLINKKILGIEVQDAEVLITCADESVFRCKHLYWGAGIDLFISLLSNRRQLPPQVLEAAQKFAGPKPLLVQYRLSHQIFNENQTLFIPISQTHEWGHFIGEAREVDGQSVVEFLHLVDLEEVSEAEVAKRIRLLFKSLAKIDSGFTKNIAAEKVYLDDKSFSTAWAKEDLDVVSNHFSKVTFLEDWPEQ